MRANLAAKVEITSYGSFSISIHTDLSNNHSSSRYTMDAGNGRRGRCGRTAPTLSDGQIPICNPDDPAAYCCSNGGYCGNTKDHCECDGCVDFKKTPSYVYKPATWWTYLQGPENIGKSRYGIRLAHMLCPLAISRGRP